MVRAIASNYVALAVQAAWLLVLTALLASERGAQVLGVWTVALAAAGYLRLLDLGVGVTVARFIAVDAGPGRRTEVLSSGVVALAGVCLPVALGGFVLAFTGAQVGAAIGIAVAGTAILLPLSVFGHALYGMERIVERNAFTVGRLLASLVATVVGVLAGWSPAGFIAAAMAAETAVALLQAVRVVSAPGGVGFRPSQVRRETARELMRFGVPTFGLQAATQIVYYSDALVIGAALGTSRAGVYAVAMRLVEGASLLLGQISDAFLPVLARLGAGPDREGARRQAIAGARSIMLVAGPTVAVLVGAGAPLVSLWVGPGYGGAELPLVLLAVALLFNAPLRFPVVWAMSAGRHGRVAAVALGEAFANVVLSIALVHPLGLGGVALASLVTIAVSNGVVIPVLLARDLGVPAVAWYARPTVSGLLVVGVLAAPCAALVRPDPSAGVALLLAAGLGAASLAALLLVRPRRPVSEPLLQ